MDKANLQPVLVNVSGIRYHVPRDVFSKLPPADRVEVYDNGSAQDGKTTEHFYFKNRAIFEMVINYYGGSGLHAPESSCPKELADDLSFWGIELDGLISCCFMNVKRQLNELSIMNDFIEYQADRTPYDAKEQTDMTKLRRRIWRILDFKENTYACRVYFVLSVLIVMTSAVSIAVSTLPQFKIKDSANGTKICMYNPPPVLFRNLLVQSDDSGSANGSNFIPTVPATTLMSTSLNSTFGNRSGVWSFTNSDVPSSNLPNSPSCDKEKITNPENPYYFIFFYIELAINLFFSIDFLLRFATCPIKRYFVKDKINIAEFSVMLCAIARYIVEIGITEKSSRELFKNLFYLQTLRVVRIFRVLHHVRAFQILCFTLSLSLKEISILVLYQGVVVMVLSNIIYLFEETMDFPSIPDTWWYTFVSMTTLGYGDMVPKSLVGRIVGSIATVVGLVLFSLVIPIVASTFMTVYNIAQSTSDTELRGNLEKERKSGNEKLEDQELSISSH